MGGIQGNGELLESQPAKREAGRSLAEGGLEQLREPELVLLRRDLTRMVPCWTLGWKPVSGGPAWELE